MTSEYLGFHKQQAKLKNLVFKHQQSLTELYSKGTGCSDGGCLSIKSWNWAIQVKGERGDLKKKSVG